ALSLVAEPRRAVGLLPDALGVRLASNTGVWYVLALPRAPLDPCAAWRDLAALASASTGTPSHASGESLMTFRTRLLLAFAPVVLVPLLVFGIGVRRAVRDRLAAQYRRRVDALVAVIEEDFAQRGRSIGDRLTSLTAAALEDNRLRLAAVQAGDRQYLLDYAGSAMRLAGLDMLQIQDASGRI